MCVQLGRPRGARRFEGRRHTPAARSSQWYTPNQRNSLHSSRKSEHTCEGTRAERAWEGHGERVVAVPQHATRRCGGRAGMVWVWVGR